MSSTINLLPRVAALERAMGELDRSLPINIPPEPELARKQTIHNLIGRLELFGGDQFRFFKASYQPDDPLYQYFICETESQIGNDLEVIERTADQRMSSAPPSYRQALSRADELAYTALVPAKPALSSPGDQTALAYFQKSPAVRVIPYAPVALIGIPFTTLDVICDYLATPHEVGHYVYWHGRVPQDPTYGADAGLPLYVALRRRLQAPLGRSPVRNWLNEIFADVYGCAIGGPVMAITFQDLQLDRAPGDFFKDDEKHPIPFLRPDIYHRVLGKMGFARYAKAAEARWEDS